MRSLPFVFQSGQVAHCESVLKGPFVNITTILVISTWQNEREPKTNYATFSEFVVILGIRFRNQKLFLIALDGQDYAN